MELMLRPMSFEERNYCYSQSDAVSNRAGLIGYMRAYLGENENFHSNFYDYQKDYKSTEFCAEFNKMIDVLQSDIRYGQMLKNITNLKRFCKNQKSFEPLGQEYGVRIDTSKYSYMLRLNPYKGNYNVYCYCYIRNLLERHMKNASKGIRFITTDYKEKFVIDDGDIVQMTTQDNRVVRMVCNYLDEYHFEGYANGLRETYHIYQFADLIKKEGYKEVIPIRASLPVRCYVVPKDEPHIMCIHKGMGCTYLSTKGSRSMLLERANVENLREEVTEAQKAAMYAGCMLGWDSPAADPKNYDENGKMMSIGKYDRGGCR